MQLGTIEDRQFNSFMLDPRSEVARRVIAQFPASYFDAFGRFRVAQPFKLYEYGSEVPHDYVRYHTKKESGSATVTQDTSKAQTYLNLTTADGDEAIFQSRRAIQYNKANEQEAFFTWRPATPKANLIQECGYGDDKNGLFFRMNGTTMQVVIRSNTSGSVVETTFDQSEWDDGRDIDFTTNKQFVFYVDFGWLSSRGPRFVVDNAGILTVVKSYLISGLLSEPFMATPNLPMRVRAVNNGTTASSSVVAFSCWAVQSSGSEVQEGPVRSISTGLTPISLSTTEVVGAGIRLNADCFNGSAVPRNFMVTPYAGNDFVYYKVVYNPTLVGDTWNTAADGRCDTLTGVTSYSGGSVILDGHFPLGDKQAKSDTFFNKVLNDIYLGTDLDGTADALIITFEMDASTGSCFFAGQYKEYA